MNGELLELADAIAACWTIPGADGDDVRQLARIAAWEATRQHDAGRGVPLTAFARMVVKARLYDAWRAATARKHDLLTAAVRHGVADDGSERDVLAGVADDRADVLELVSQRERLGRIVAAVPLLTELERAALADVSSGRLGPRASKRLDNAVQRARRKLRAAQPETPAATPHASR